MTYKEKGRRERDKTCQKNSGTHDYEVREKSEAEFHVREAEFRCGDRGIGAEMTEIGVRGHGARIPEVRDVTKLTEIPIYGRICRHIRFRKRERQKAGRLFLPIVSTR